MNFTTKQWEEIMERFTSVDDDDLLTTKFLSGEASDPEFVKKQLVKFFDKIVYQRIHAAHEKSK